MQERLGLREKLEVIGRRNIRDYMPDQHRSFFAQLPFLIVGSVDANGQPWASVLAGLAGFTSSPDAHHLRINARPLPGDPLNETLTEGATIGLLGIEPHTRRRNRMNGIVEEAGPDGFTVRVVRSFGNCPKYIQARAPAPVSGTAAAGTVHRSGVLDVAMRAIIAAADTFFIATAYADKDKGFDRPHGADVSHRGGRPGFVHIDERGALTVPDYVGNSYFNTIGNLLLEPRAGLLFIDFATGDLLYLAADGEVVLEGEAVRAVNGAQRLLHLRIREAIRVERSLPLTWGQAELSPFLAAIEP